jgi:cell division protein FtsQ
MTRSTGVIAKFRHGGARPTGKNRSITIKYPLAICGLMLIGYLTYQGLSRSVFLQLTDITVSGCRNIHRDLVIEGSGLTLRTNLLAIDLKAVDKKIEGLDWVETAEVTRKWPDTLAIVIKEQKPAAIINLKDGLYYLDQNATVFATVTPHDDTDWPVINCAGRSAAELNNHLDTMEAIHRTIIFLQQARDGNPVLPCQNISEIAIAENGNMTLYLLDQVFPIYLGKDDAKRQYGRLVNILKELYKNHEILSIDYIDMNYLQDKALVSMARPDSKNTKG